MSNETEGFHYSLSFKEFNNFLTILTMNVWLWMAQAHARGIWAM
jgi:hypothetical protein